MKNNNGSLFRNDLKYAGMKNINGRLFVMTLAGMLKGVKHLH